MNRNRRAALIRSILPALAGVMLLSCARGMPRAADPEPGAGVPANTLLIPPLPLPPTVRVPDEVAGEPGLTLRLREAEVGAPGEPAPGPQAPAAELSGERTQALLARLPALPAGDTASFRFPAASPPPPRSGRVVLSPFPPPDSLPAPTVAERVREPLRVVRVLPSGETELAPHVTITFSDAMVPLTTVAGTEERASPARLTPQPAGRWLWLDTRTLRFQPEGRLPMATTFTVEVPAGTRSAAGEALGQPVRATFSTPAPRAIGAYPALHPDEETRGDPRAPRPYAPGRTHGHSVSLEPVIVVAFDQQIDPAAVLRVTRLLADGRAHPVRLARAEELAADSVARELTAGLPAGRWLALRPVQPLPGDSDVRVHVDAGVPSAEGPRTSAQAQEARFRTYGALRIASHGCWSQLCRPGMPWQIQLTNALDEDAWSDEHVRVEPALRDMVVRALGTQIQIAGDAQPNTRYTVTLSSAVRDVFGQQLEAPRTVVFDVGASLPTIALPGAPLIVLDPDGPARIVVRTQGHRALRVRVHRVTPDQWFEYGAALERWQQSRGGPLDLPGQSVTSTVVELSGGTDYTETLIDVGPALRDGLGHAIVAVEPVGAGAAPSERMQNATHVWVQSTRIGVSARIDAEDAFVWTSSLRTGEPLGGADVRLVPSGRRAVTNADGTARIPLSAAGDGALIATLGADAALLPAQEYAVRTRAAWVQRPGMSELRWFMLTDRGLYQPGDTVHFKGWLRRMPGSGPADLRLAEDVGGIEFRMRGPRREELAVTTLRPGALGGFSTTVALPEALNLGHASIELHALPTEQAGSRAFHSLQVQEFRRPDHEVRLEADPGPHIVGDVIDATMHATYYGGGGLGGAPVEWRVTTQPGHYRPPGWDRWHFGRAPWGWRGPRAGAGAAHTITGVTDASGAHGVHIDLLSVDPPFTTALRAEAQVSDVTRQIGSAGVDLLVHPAAVNAGLRLGRSWLYPGQTADLDVIAVDHDGRAAAGSTVEITAHAVGDDIWSETAAPDTAPGIPVCRVTPTTEPARCTFTPQSSGTHRLRADVRDDAGRISRTELMVWVAGRPGAPDPRSQPGTFELVADRDEYQPGDTARILVQPPFQPAEALITVRTATVLSTQRAAIDSAAYEFRLPITEAHIPGVHVRVDVVDAERGINFAFGEVALTVPPHRRALDVRVAPRDTLAVPGAEVSIDVEVRDADGRAAANAEVALWMVDEAVLALGGYALRDPLDAFYAPIGSYMHEQNSRRWVVQWPRSAGPGTVSGIVLAAERGHALAGARVQLAGTAIETRTAFDGSFTLHGVAPGEYVIEVTTGDGLSGRRTITVRAEGVHVGNLVLGAAGLSEGVWLSGMQEQTRAAAAAGLAPPPAPTPAPPPPPEMALDAITVTGKAAGEQEVDIRADFAPLAFFEPSLRTDANGRVRVTARLPESLTRYRIMAVAVSGAQRFGTGEAVLTARKELMVRVLAPRFLNYGDRFELPVLVQNATSAPMQVDVAARASGIDMSGAGGRSVTLAAGARTELRFRASAPLPGSAHVQVIAVSGAATDAAAVTLPVYTPATAEAFATYGTIAGAAPVVLPVARPRGVIEGFGGLEVSITSTALHSLTDAVLYLHRYPFAGVEHIASRVLAVAALRDVLNAFAAEGLPDPDELVAYTQSDIADLVAMQRDDGGWGFWRGAVLSHPFVSMHAAHALERARDRGFDVPPAALQRALGYLRGMEAHTADWPLTARQSATAYALYVRHRIGDASATAEARRMASAAPTQVGGELPVEAAGWLLHVLAQDASSRADVDALLRTLQNRLVETAGTVTFAERYEDGEHLLLHSRRRTDAVVLEGLIAADADDDIVTRLAQSLLAHRTAGRWAGTQENAWVLLALDRYFRTYEAVTPAFTSRVWLGERFAGTHAFQGRTIDRQHIDIPMPELLRADSQELVIARAGEGRMYYRAGVRYAPADLRTPATDRGFEVSRTYEGVDDVADVQRDADGTWRVKAGARVRVRVTLIAPSVRYHAALVDPLPAGFEPLNPELRGTGFTDDPGPRTPARPAPPDAWRSTPDVWRVTWFEHHNLRDDRAEAFASLLSAGTYEYTYLARATTPGTFVVPPPRAEMMYQPETFGRGDGAIVIVEER